LSKVDFLRSGEITTTVDDSDGISKHRLMPMSPIFYNKSK